MAIEMARGRPSGIDTISKTTASMITFMPINSAWLENRDTSESNMMRKMRKIPWVKALKTVAARAYFPICYPTFSSFISNKVYCSSIT